MSGLSAINSVSLTALSALNRLNDRVGEIAQSVAADTDTGNIAAGLAELPQVGIAYQANLFVLQTVQELSRDLILRPRR